MTCPRNWEDVVPEDVALAQRAFDRGRRILRVYRAGCMQKEIARRLGVTSARVHQIVKREKRRMVEEGCGSPVERWLAGGQVDFEMFVDEFKRVSRHRRHFLEMLAEPRDVAPR